MLLLVLSGLGVEVLENEVDLVGSSALQGYEGDRYRQRELEAGREEGRKEAVLTLSGPNLKEEGGKEREEEGQLE